MDEHPAESFPAGALRGIKRNFLVARIFRDNSRARISISRARISVSRLRIFSFAGSNFSWVQTCISRKNEKNNCAHIYIVAYVQLGLPKASNGFTFLCRVCASYEEISFDFMRGTCGKICCCVPFSGACAGSSGVNRFRLQFFFESPFFQAYAVLAALCCFSIVLHGPPKA